MTRRRWQLLGVIGGAAIVLSLGFVLGLPFSSRAQQPSQPAATAATPSGDYVGAETCKGCHEESFSKFSHTKMARLFLSPPEAGPDDAQLAHAAPRGQDDLYLVP